MIVGNEVIFGVVEIGMNAIVGGVAIGVVGDAAGRDVIVGVEGQRGHIRTVLNPTIAELVVFVVKILAVGASCSQQAIEVVVAVNPVAVGAVIR